MKVAAVFLLVLSSHYCRAQDFTKYYQDSADVQVAMHLLKDSSGSFWMGGYKSAVAENSRAWIYRLNPAGEVLNKIGFPGTETHVWGGMILQGNQIFSIIGLQDFFGATRYFLAGIAGDSLQSWRYLPALDNAALHDSRPGAGGRLLISGFRGSDGIAGNDFFLARINTETAETDWVFYEGFGPNDHISTCRELPDGSVLFCGTLADQGNYNPCMGKLDTAGQLIWLNVLSTIWNDGSQKFEVAENGDIWLVGESSTSAGSFFDTELFRLDASGQLLWQQWLGSPGQDAAFHIQRKENQPGFWVAGYSNAGQNGSGPISPFLMSLDADGNSLGEVFWPMNSPSPVYDAVMEGDSVFYLCGTSAGSAFLLRRKQPEFSLVFTVSVQNPAEKVEETPCLLKTALAEGLIKEMEVWNVFGQVVGGLPEIISGRLKEGQMYFIRWTDASGENRFLKYRFERQ